MHIKTKHQAADSMTYVRKGTQILNGSYDRKRKKKPWGLQKDGDLWKHFYEAVKAKGVSSVKLSWTKGHASRLHVEEGITTEHHKAGNDKVDQVADRGAVQGYDEGMRELVVFFAGQREETKKVIIWIQ